MVWYVRGQEQQKSSKARELQVKSDAQKVNSNYVEWSAGVCGKPPLPSPTSVLNARAQSSETDQDTHSVFVNSTSV